MQLMLRQPFGPLGRAGRAQGKNFGMCGRIGQFAHPVPRTGDKASTRRDDHRADRHLTAFCRPARLVQRDIHPAI